MFFMEYEPHELLRLTVLHSWGKLGRDRQLSTNLLVFLCMLTSQCTYLQKNRFIFYHKQFLGKSKVYTPGPKSQRVKYRLHAHCTKDTSVTNSNMP